MARKKSKATPAQRRALKKARAALKRKRNAAKRRGRKAAATRKRRAAPKRKRTYRKRAASRVRKNSPKRRRKSTVAKRRTRKRTRRNPRRRKIRGVRQIRRKVYTRNPPITMKNMGKIAVQGLKDAGAVTAGKIGARFVSGFIPSFGEGPVMNFAKQGIAAIAVGFLGGQVLPREYARFLIAGALSAPVETFLQSLPVVGDLVSGQVELGEAMGYGLPIGEGPEYDLPVGEYVQPDIQMGEYVEMYP